MPKSKRAGTASSSVATKVATKPAKAAKAAVCPAALPPLQSKRNKEWKIHTQGYFKTG
ncbi:hypothetical protein ACWGNA_07955 [Brucella cytisi]|uniref:hypothetical protein n=1 Tax=Brucella cytisi TaxID=407152 RepID=UPI00142DCD60